MSTVLTGIEGNNGVAGGINNGKYRVKFFIKTKENRETMNFFILMNECIWDD